jgi:cathepsin L
VHKLSGQRLAQDVDWRDKGIVTPIKNQGHCGSCWSFSTTGSVEGQYALKYGTLKSFSEQQLVDCSKTFGNHGCKGGLMDNAFRYLRVYKDELESSYPYTAEDGLFCKYQASLGVVGLTGYTDIPRGSEAALLDAAGTIGPISVAIDAGHRSFQLYKSGVYYEPECSSTKLDHGVLVVGYGVYEGEEYWLVKNSWGPAWGQEGYVRMKRNYGNMCGIATQASYPRVA